MSYMTTDQIPPGFSGLGILVMTYANKAGDKLTGTDTQIEDYVTRVLKGSISDWEFVKGTDKDVSVPPKEVTYKKAFDWGALWGKAADVATKYIKTPETKTPSTPPGYLPPAPKTGMKNMLIIGGIGLVAVIGLMMFMGGGKGKKRRR